MFVRSIEVVGGLGYDRSYGYQNNPGHGYSNDGDYDVRGGRRKGMAVHVSIFIAAT